MNCCVVPFGIDGFAGVIAIDTRTAGATVKVVLPVTPLEALIWEVPCATPLARPPDVIVATLRLEELQLTAFVRSWVLPSE